MCACNSTQKSELWWPINEHEILKIADCATSKLFSKPDSTDVPLAAGNNSMMPKWFRTLSRNLKTQSYTEASTQALNILDTFFREKEGYSLLGLTQSAATVASVPTCIHMLLVHLCKKEILARIHYLMHTALTPYTTPLTGIWQWYWRPEDPFTFSLGIHDKGDVLIL